METKEQLKEEFLTCIVCHEVFRDPVTLHCGHTFCTQCVTSYTKTQQQAIDAKSLPCPCCRELTQVPYPEKPVEEWAEQIRTGFFVKGLVDTFVVKEKDVVPCSSCKADGDTSSAVVWCGECQMALCSSCQKAHRKFLKAHEVDDLTRKDVQKVAKPKKRICQSHSDSVIDMYCQKCDQAACPRCCIEHHKNCEGVKKLSQAMDDIDKVLKKREDFLTKEIERRKKEIPQKKSQIKELEESADTAKLDVKTYSQKVSEEIVKVFSRDMQQCMEIAKRNLLADLKSEKDHLQLAEQSKDLVQRALQSPSDMDHYEVYKTTPKNDRLEYPNPSRVIKLELVQSKALAMQLVSCRTVLDDRGFIGKKTQAFLVEKLDFQFSDDVKKPFICDVAVINSEEGMRKIVATDSNNPSVKLIAFNGNRKTEESLKFEKSPYTIAPLPNSRFAVTVESKGIMIISMIPYLALESVIKTNKSYTGLAALTPSTFVCTASSTGCVEVIDLSGAVLRTLRPGIFAFPYFVIITNPSQFLISDVNSRSITCLTSEGQIANPCSKTNTLLTHPRGITQSRAGETFLVDRESNKVMQITSTGEYVKDVLTKQDGLVAPQCVHVDDSNLMYVAHDTRYVNVYHFT